MSSPKAFIFGALLASLATNAGWVYIMFRPKPIVTETAQPEVRRADGSVILERSATNPDATPRLTSVPKGGVIQRVVTVEVPSPPPTATADSSPTTVELTIYKDEDGGERVVAATDKGVILGGLDVPVAPAVALPKYKWVAGGGYFTNGYSAFVGREFFNNRVQVAVVLTSTKSAAGNALGLGLTAGVRF
jgi:hypothetical protein